MNDYLALHLQDKITEAKGAIEAHAGTAREHEKFVTQFQETDPAAAVASRFWVKFHLAKVAHFEAILKISRSKLQKRTGAKR